MDVCKRASTGLAHCAACTLSLTIRISIDSSSNGEDEVGTLWRLPSGAGEVEHSVVFQPAGCELEGRHCGVAAIAPPSPPPLATFRGCCCRLAVARWILAVPGLRRSFDSWLAPAACLQHTACWQVCCPSRRLMHTTPPVARGYNARDTEEGERRASGGTRAPQKRFFRQRPHMNPFSIHTELAEGR